MPKIIIEFPDEEIKKEFLGWFLDGGGDQTFENALELREVEIPEGSFLKLSWQLPISFTYSFEKEV